MNTDHFATKSRTAHILTFIWIAIGTFLAAFAIEVFFYPNKLIDGGVVGISMILSNLLGHHLLPFFLVLLNLPFLYLGMRSLGRSFVIHFFVALALFGLWLIILPKFLTFHFQGDPLEVVVIGGAILGVGIGLIIRNGGCTDGTEILGIIVNQRTGISVGQVVFACNLFIFGALGLVFRDWHPPILSVIAYFVAIKVMDVVIVGLEETKSVTIISRNSSQISKLLVHELGLGLTVVYGRGGFSGEEQEVLYVIAERLQLADLKELVYQEDPHAFVAIENLHEVTNHRKIETPDATKKVKSLFKKVLSNGKG